LSSIVYSENYFKNNFNGWSDSDQSGGSVFGSEGEPESESEDSISEYDPGKDSNSKVYLCGGKKVKKRGK
jgi:hypothetical protein